MAEVSLREGGRLFHRCRGAWALLRCPRQLLMVVGLRAGHRMVARLTVVLQCLVFAAGSGAVSLGVAGVALSVQVVLWFRGRLRMLLCHRHVVSAAVGLCPRVLGVPGALAAGSVVLMVVTVICTETDLCQVELISRGSLPHVPHQQGQGDGNLPKVPSQQGVVEM